MTTSKKDPHNNILNILGDGERNYHIFYCMLAGLTKEHKQKLDLKDASSYKYLTGVRIITSITYSTHNSFILIIGNVSSQNQIVFLFSYSSGWKYHL